MMRIFHEVNPAKIILMNVRIFCLSFFAVVITQIDRSFGQEQVSVDSIHVRAVKSEIRKKILTHFSPPAEFKNKKGDYRSPLLFYNGRWVRRKVDWIEKV
jgi:hypothetical protein